MVYADEILDYSGERRTGVTAGSYGPSADVSPEAGGTITVPQLTVNEKGLITGAVERTVTLPDGGGGGGEEQFEQVYTTTLAEDSAAIEITDADMGGAFVDVQVFCSFESSVISEVDITFADSNSTLLQGTYLGVGVGEETALSFGFFSWNGLAAYNGISETRSGTSGLEQGMPSFAVNPGASGYGGLYPVENHDGIYTITMTPNGGDFPAGTSITVYARKAVQTGGE